MEASNKENQEISIGHLMANIVRLQASRADQLMEQTGLFRGQAILLMILSNQDGLTHSEIAKRLKVSPAAITKVIKRLESSHFLERRHDATDERLSRVFLLDDGWAVIYQIKAAFQQIDQILLSNLSSEEQNNLIRLLTQVYANLLK